MDLMPKPITAGPKMVAALRKQAQDHKFSHGSALVLAGGAWQGGAARLAARAALRVGAGVVTLGCPKAAMAENAARLDAILLRVVDADADLVAVLQDARITALCLGPGLGLGARQAGLVAAALQGTKDARAVVLDADALTVMAREAALLGAVHAGCVLTPHLGEFVRLFPDLAAALTEDGQALTAKAKAARLAAERLGCVVLLKGAQTVIADPAGRCALQDATGAAAAPWLATAGSGDVLAGFITGLLAHGFSGFDAACTGAWLHAQTARSFGPGLIAEDLPDHLPQVLRAMGV